MAEGKPVSQSKPLKKYPTLGVCGLDCGMCPRYYTDGPSRCPGCAGPGFFNKHPSCSFITCCVKERKLEVCGECADFPCARSKSEVEYRSVPESSSYPTYKNVYPNFEFIKKHGIGKFIEGQSARRTLLERLLERYDDGRSKSFFCKAAAFLDAESLARAIGEAESRMKAGKMEKSDVKAMSKIMKAVITEIALEKGIEYFARRAP